MKAYYCIRSIAEYKLMQLGAYESNRINHSDSKPVYFYSRLLSDSDSNDKSESMISISI